MQFDNTPKLMYVSQRNLFWILLNKPNMDCKNHISNDLTSNGILQFDDENDQKSVITIQIRSLF